MADIGKIIPATPEPALAPTRFPVEPKAEAVGEFARSVRENKDEPPLSPASCSFGKQNDQAAASGEPAAGQAGNSKTTESAGGKNSLPLHGDALLAGMQSQPRESAAPAAGPAAAAAPRPDGDLLAKLADRILVSAADAKGGAEVRISVRDEVLPGTEVHIRREAGGDLSVRFVTQDVLAERMLSPDRLDVLRQTLAGNLQAEVRVTVSSPDGGLTAEADSRGDRESGRSGQRDQPRDGRSRQHGIFEADQDEV